LLDVFQLSVGNNMADEMLDGSALSSVQEHLLNLGDKVDGLKETVKEHIAKDMKYYNNYNKEETQMEDSSGLIAAMLAGGNRNDGSGVGAGAGAGLGAGLLGGVLGGALLGNRGGLLGNGAVAADVAVGVTPAMLTAGLSGVTDALQNTTVMQSLGDIKASIPLAEGNVQLALAGSQAAVVNQINMGTMATINGQALINKNVSDAIATSLASQSAIKESIAAYGVANLNATKDAQFSIATIVKDDGEKTRALITSNAISELQRQLTVSQTNAMEDRLNSRSRETEINISNVNTAVAQQQQAQQQSQTQTILLNGILGLMGNLQNAVATNSNLIVGNSGATTTGTQTSAPVNVRT
jgi:hypothetical protein